LDFVFTGWYWGYPPPYFRSFRMNTLAAIPARSLGNKDLEVTSLFLKDLASFCCQLGPPGWALLLSPGVGPPFRPEQKVKLDKGEATRGGLFFRHDFLGYDVGAAPLKA
jgi:hypothetical protein